MTLIQASGMDFPDNLEELLHTDLEQGTDEVDKFLGSYDLRHYQPLRKQVSYVATLGKVRALWVRHLADITEVIVSLPILTKGVPLFNQAIFEQHQQRIADFKADMRDAQRSLFQAASKEQLLEKADALCVQLDQNLAELAQTQALLYVAGYALRKLGKGGFSEIVGASAASAGILAREAISSFAAAQRITNRLVVDYPDEEVDELLDSSAEKSFDAGNIPDGKNTPLHHLSDTDDGAFVEVGGYVQAIEFGRIEGGTKLISLARLKDPSSGASATIAALFIHYRHIGLTTGCYVVANGLFHQSSALAGDTPAVEVDRLSLKTLAESNWRIAFLERSTPWFQVWRNGYNMRWSWGVHRPTGDFDGLGPEGAAEPVFVPFLRGGK
jgi:hypothetical protein